MTFSSHCSVQDTEALLLAWGRSYILPEVIPRPQQHSDPRSLLSYWFTCQALLNNTHGCI